MAREPRWSPPEPQWGLTEISEGQCPAQWSVWADDSEIRMKPSIVAQLGEPTYWEGRGRMITVKSRKAWDRGRKTVSKCTDKKSVGAWLISIIPERGFGGVVRVQPQPRIPG